MRVTHLPTGLVADIHHERSQHNNNQVAIRLLKARFFAFTEDQKLPEAERLYGERGVVRPERLARNYVLQPYRLARDRRTETRSDDPEAVLDGDIRPFQRAWLTPPAGA